MSTEKPRRKEVYGVQCMDHIVKNFEVRDEAIAYLHERQADYAHEGRNPSVWSIDAEEAGLGQYWKP